MVSGNHDCNCPLSWAVSKAITQPLELTFPETYRETNINYHKKTLKFRESLPRELAVTNNKLLSLYTQLSAETSPTLTTPSQVQLSLP